MTAIADDPLAVATRIATEISRKSPDSTAAAKRLLHATYASKDDGRRLGIEADLQRHLLGGWNQVSAYGPLPGGFEQVVECMYVRPSANPKASQDAVQKRQWGRDIH